MNSVFEQNYSSLRVWTKKKINYDNYGLINLPVDGVFFKERLTINQVKTNYSYMQVCVWNISGTIKDTV